MSSKVWIFLVLFLASCATAWQLSGGFPQPDPAEAVSQKDAENLPQSAEGGRVGLRPTPSQGPGEKNVDLTRHDESQTQPERRPLSSSERANSGKTEIPRANDSLEERLKITRINLEKAQYRDYEIEEIMQSWSKALTIVEAELGPRPNAELNPRPEFHDEIFAYDQALREQMDDSLYDQGRYADGLSNRVEIKALPGGPIGEELHALNPGDRILAINGEEIYTVADFYSWRKNNGNPNGPTGRFTNTTFTIERPSTGETLLVDSPRAMGGRLHNIRVRP